MQIDSIQWHWQFNDKYAIFPLKNEELFLSKRWLPMSTWILMLETIFKSIFYHGIHR